VGIKHMSHEHQLTLWLCVVQMWYPSNKRRIGIVALQMSCVMDEVRSGCPSTSNMYINDNNEMVQAHRCVSLKLRAGTHPLTSQCLGCCPWMLSQSVQQMGVKTTVWPTEARTSLTNLHCYKAECTDFLLHSITHGCTILNHRLR
jgi:hypothetical protein